MASAEKYLRVCRVDDDRDVPLTGLVFGCEEDFRVLVVWGEALFDPDKSGEAKIEYFDELRPVRSV